MNQPIIRPALASDLPRLLEIYNEDRRVWFEAHNKDNHPLIVLEQDNTVWGYASLSTFNAKPAYASSTELSVYVHKSARGLGYGQLLTEAILQMAVADSATHRVYSLITAENQASIALHRKLGFRLVGTITQAGTKFGRWLDVTYWEKAV